MAEGFGATRTYTGSAARHRLAIMTLDERRRFALDQVNNARISWYHAKIIVVAGVGFFTDAFDMFAINLAAIMLGYLYGDGTACQFAFRCLSRNQELGLKIAAPVGALFGQLVFGWLADVVGRKRMYGVELIIIMVATFGQAVTGSSAAINVIAMIAVWRFILGVGIGGDYPLSAVISSEFSATAFRGRVMSAVFAAQGWGSFTASLVARILVAIYKDNLLHDSAENLDSADYMWRILIGFGCIPAACALYFRMTIPESPRFTMDIEGKVNQATYDLERYLGVEEFTVDPDPTQLVERGVVPKGTFGNFIAYFSKPRNLRHLIGTSWSWFALDFSFYGIGLNTTNLFQAIGFGLPSSTGTLQEQAYANLIQACNGNLVLTVAGLIPGYYVTLLLIDSWGRKPIQLLGFSVLTVLFLIMGFGFNVLSQTTASQKAFFALLCLAQFFENFGPNTTTFIVPGELFPTRFRTTAVGISAASGKLGAVLAQVVFTHVKRGHGKTKTIIEVLAFVMLSGIGSTLLLPETKDRTLEDLSNEPQEGFVAKTS